MHYYTEKTAGCTVYEECGFMPGILAAIGTALANFVDGAIFAVSVYIASRKNEKTDK